MFVCGLVWPKMSQVAWPMARTQRAGRDKFYERADWLWSPLLPAAAWELHFGLGKNDPGQSPY